MEGYQSAWSLFGVQKRATLAVAKQHGRADEHEHALLLDPIQVDHTVISVRVILTFFEPRTPFYPTFSWHSLY